MKRLKESQWILSAQRLPRRSERRNSKGWTVEWVALLSAGLSREWWHVGVTQTQVAVSPKADAKMDGIGNLYIT